MVESWRTRGLDDAAYKTLTETLEPRLFELRPERREQPERHPVAAATPAPEPSPIVQPAEVVSAAPAPQAAPSLTAEVAPAAAPVVAMPTAETPAARPSFPARPHYEPPVPSTVAGQVHAQPVPRPADTAPPRPPREPRDPGVALKQWAAHRQADLLLYLGAFMLSVSALIFVNYQGTAMTGLAKSALLGSYTVLFLFLGMGLRRWDRVREAGPVFVGLAAILTPLNFVLLYFQVLDGKELSQAAIWFAGSMTTALLYFFLAWRGFGRFYVAPAVAASIVAWGALGATIELPVEWFGAWYAALAASVSVVTELRLSGRLRKAATIGAFAIGVPALAWSSVAAAAAIEDALSRGPLSVTLLFGTAALLVSVYHSRSRLALALLPPAGAAFGASTLWAFGRYEPEWLSVALAVIAAGYIGAEYVSRRDQEGWRYLSAFAAGLAIYAGHQYATFPDTNPWQLATMYALVTAGTAWLAVGRRFEPAWFALPVGLSAAGTSSMWAADADVQYWALAPLSVAIVMSLVATLPYWNGKFAQAWILPYASVLALAPVLLLLPYQDAPWTGAISFALAAIPWTWSAMLYARNRVAVPDLVSESLSSTLAAQLYANGAGILLLVTTGLVTYALALSVSATGWTFAAVAATACIAGAAAGRRWAALDGAIIPSGALAVAIATWVTRDLPAQQSLMTGLMAPLAALAIRNRGNHAWRASMYTAGAFAVLTGHLAAAEANGHGTWELPVAYGLLIASLAWDVAFTRFWPSLLGIPAALSLGAASALWLAGIEAEYWAFPALGIAMVIATSYRLWMGISDLKPFGWPYALVLGLAPLPFAALYMDHAWRGAAAFALAAATWLAVAVLSKDWIAVQFSPAGSSTPRLAQQMLANGSGALLLAALGYTNLGFGLSIEDSAWVFAGTGLLAWVASGAISSRVPGMQGILGPIGGAALIIAALSARADPGQGSAMLAMGTIAAGWATNAPNLSAWRTTFIAVGLLAVGSGHLAIEDGHQWQLPLAYFSLLAAFSWDAAKNRFDPSWLPVPALLTATVTAVLWAREIDEAYWAFPALASAAAVAAASPWWRSRPALNGAGSAYVLGLALAPFVFVPEYQATPWAGAGAFFGASVLWAVAAFNTERWMTPFGLGSLARVSISVGSTALLFIATGYFARAMGFTLQEGAWLFLALAMVAWLSLSQARRIGPAVVQLGLIAGVSGTVIAVVAARDFDGQVAAMLAISAAGSAGAIYGVRRWAMLCLPSVMAGASLAFLWRWSPDLETWSLGLAYAAVAVTAWPSLSKWRDWQPGERSATAAFVPGGWMAAGLACAAIAVLDRRADLAATEDIQSTIQWGALTLVVLAASTFALFEGYRLQQRIVFLLGTAVAMLAAEMAISMLRPFTLQAYTTPLGIYLLAISLTIRHSEELLGQHMSRHEALASLAMLTIVLPGANDALSSENLRWTLLLIGEGIAFLFAGFLLSQRWIVVGGVMTLVAVAGRFFTTGGTRPPFWVTLGLLGTILLVLGVVLLGAREWWDRRRDQVTRWWLGPGGGMNGHAHV